MNAPGPVRSEGLGGLGGLEGLETRARPATRLWIAVALAVAGIGLASLFVVRALARGPVPPFLDDAQAGARAGNERAPDDDVLRISGEGSALPLARALVAAYLEERPDVRVRVHQSIGSDGGIRATADGAIDIGLISRPLSSEERAAGLVGEPLALDAVVFAAHPRVPVDGVTSQDVLDLYAGRRATWADGTRVQVVQRDATTGHHAVVEQAIRGFSAVSEESDRLGRWRLVFDGHTMQRTLMEVPGSIGLLDLGTAVAGAVPIKVLTLDGVEPTEAAVRGGRYPLHLSLALVVRRDDERARRFIDFARSARGMAITEASGYLTRAEGASP